MTSLSVNKWYIIPNLIGKVRKPLILCEETALQEVSNFGHIEAKKADRILAHEYDSKNTQSQGNCSVMIGKLIIDYPLTQLHLYALFFERFKFEVYYEFGQ